MWADNQELSEKIVDGLYHRRREFMAMLPIPTFPDFMVQQIFKDAKSNLVILFTEILQEVEG